MRLALNKVKQKPKISTPAASKNPQQQNPSVPQRYSKENWTQTIEELTKKKSSDNDTSKEFDCDLNALQKHFSSIATVTEKEYRYGQSASPKCTCSQRIQKGNATSPFSESRLINWKELSLKIKDLEEQIVEINMRYQKRETNLLRELEQKRIKWIVKYQELKQDAEKMKEFYEKGKTVWKFYLGTINEALNAIYLYTNEQNTKNKGIIDQIIIEVNEINNLVISNHYSGTINAKTVLNESQFQLTNRFDSVPTSCSRNSDYSQNQLNKNHKYSHTHQNSNHQLSTNESTVILSQICSKINNSLKKADEISQSFDSQINVRRNNQILTLQQIQILEKIELLLKQNSNSQFGNTQEISALKKKSFIQQQQSSVLNQIIMNNISAQDSQSKYQKKKSKESTSPRRNDFLKLAAQFSPRTLQRDIDGSFQFKALNVIDDDGDDDNNCDQDRQSESTQKEFVIQDESLFCEVQKRISFSSQKKQEIEQRYSRDIGIIRRLFHDVSTSLNFSEKEQHSNGFNKYDESSLTKNSAYIGDDALTIQAHNLQNGLHTPMKSLIKNQNINNNNTQNNNNNNNNNNISTSYLLKNTQLVQSVMVPSFQTISDMKSQQQTQIIFSNNIQKSEFDNNLTYSQDDDGYSQTYSNLMNSRKSGSASKHLINGQLDQIPINQGQQSESKMYKGDDKIGIQMQSSLVGQRGKYQIDTKYLHSKDIDDSRSEFTLKEDYSMNSLHKNYNKLF